MKTLFVIIGFVFFQIGYSQTIFSENINSNNVLDYFSRLQTNGSVDSGSSTDLITQIGNANTVEVIDMKANYLQLSQTGDYNTTFFVNPNNHPTDLEVNVTGTNNHVDITGSNSISEGMKINIHANDMMIFVRNY